MKIKTIKINMYKWNHDYNYSRENGSLNCVHLLQTKNFLLKSCCNTHCSLSIKYIFSNITIGIIGTTTINSQTIIFTDCNLNQILLNKCILLPKRYTQHTRHDYGLCDTSPSMCTNNMNHIRKSIIITIVTKNTARNISDGAVPIVVPHDECLPWIILAITMDILKERYIRTSMTTQHNKQHKTQKKQKGHHQLQENNTVTKLTITKQK